MARIVVVGTFGSDPYAGMAWMHMQIVAGLKRLGHEVYYFETTSAWPYDPVRFQCVQDSDYTVPYIDRVTKRFGLDDCWAYRHSYADKSWVGPIASRGVELLEHADAVFNIAGATRFAEEGLKVGRLVYYGTDPITQEIAYLNGDEWISTLIDEHDEFVTYGENLGTPECPVPPFRNLVARTRQPVLLDLWETGPPENPAFTTVANWKQEDREVEFEGESYSWSKHREFLKFLDLPGRIEIPLQLGLGLGNVSEKDQAMLGNCGWKLLDAHPLTTDPWPYRDFVRRSSGEFTVAKDQNVRLRSGWFSERSACYLAAGRPVITQDTGFGTVLPTGEGLFAFSTMDEILEAFDAVQTDYGRHARAARKIAEEYFGAETVLAKLSDDLGL